jgi:ubiquinol-cytochrome c reductase cytochrome b subunit
MNSLLRWLNDRTGISDAFKNLAHTSMVGGASWCNVLPATILFVFCVQAITGFFLWTYYSPSAQTAWESVYWLQYEVAGGWLLRAMHHYAGQTLLALAGLYLLQLIVRGWYRPPREAVYWTALLMVLCTSALLLTGDLLAWNQNSYASTQVRTKFLLLLPVIGEQLYKIAIGGPEFGHLTLTRFLALHIGFFGGGFLLLLILNRIFARRANALCATTNLWSVPGLPDGVNSTGGQAARGTPAQSGCIAPYWPDQAWRNTVASLLVLAVILALALQRGISGAHAGVAMGSPADLDPANYYAAARPEWAFRGLYEFSHLFSGAKAIVPIFVVPALIFLYYLLLPVIGRIRIGHGFNIAVTIFLLGSIIGLSYCSYSRDAADAEQQNSIAAELQQADRVIELARAKGVPATGALTLLRNDAKTQGPKIFKQYCASCHTFAHTVNLNAMGINAVEPTASNLDGFATRDWLAGLLNPEGIVSPAYWGNTKLRKGTMANFVKENLSDLDEEEKSNLRKVIIALSAEAELPQQRAADRHDAEIVKEGRKLIVEYFSCTDCHKFHDKGTLGTAPELTGYGSAQWTGTMIGNPRSKRFYSDKNDRMPSFAETGEAAKDILSARSIGLVSDWLRGQWFEKQ